jgi:hypothetical protein
MKRSDLKNMVKEAYIDLTKVKKGQVSREPGITTTLTDIDPETGKLSWDVKYEVDPQILYNKLSDLVDFMETADSGSEIGKIRDVIKTLKNKASRLMK